MSENGDSYPTQLGGQKSIPTKHGERDDEEQGIYVVGKDKDAASTLNITSIEVDVQCTPMERKDGLS
jgi:hypothetical protein